MHKGFITEEIINLLRALLAASTIWLAFNAVSQHTTTIGII